VRLITLRLGWCSKVRVYRNELADLQAKLKERGVVHCDVEPRNIVRTPDHHIGIVDFGDVLVGDALVK
jgi:Ser/Thr protein kinase RdoA (MazF antagonist)